MEGLCIFSWAGDMAMYVLLALAGDLGCSGGPTFVGGISGTVNDDL